MPFCRKECISIFWMDQSSLFYNPINCYDAVNSSSPYVTMVTALVWIHAASLNQINGSA
jgi:hypothetical protein